MDFDAMMKQALFDMENNLYGGLFAKAAEMMGDKLGMDDYMHIQDIIVAFNKRGVSTSILFEVIMEVAGKDGGTDE